MAIVRPGPLVQQITGSVASITFKQTRKGTLATRRPTKTRKTSRALQEQQARLTQLVHKWKDLTNLQRAAWSTLASQLTKTNALGQRIRWTGYQLFVHENSLPLLADQTIISDPPETGHRSGIIKVIPVITAVNMFVTVTPTYGPETVRGWAFAQRMYSSRPKWPIYWTYLGFNTGFTNAIINVKTVFEAKLGHPPAGEMVRYKAFGQKDDHLISAPYEMLYTSLG